VRPAESPSVVYSRATEDEGLDYFAQNSHLYGLDPGAKRGKGIDNSNTHEETIAVITRAKRDWPKIFGSDSKVSKVDELD